MCEVLDFFGFFGSITSKTIRPNEISSMVCEVLDAWDFLDPKNLKQSKASKTIRSIETSFRVCEVLFLFVLLFLFVFFDPINQKLQKLSAY